MKLSKKIIFLLRNAWMTAKGFVLISAITNIFQAILSFGNIIGTGLIVEALLSKKSLNQVFLLILIFSCANLTVAILKELLSLIFEYMQRQTTNKMQYMYAEDSVKVNYHFAQDGTILDLKKKSMAALPAFYIDRLGEILKYAVQFIAIITIVGYFSPLFLIILIATSVASIFLIFKTKKDETDFQNEKVEDDRKLDYIYQVMTQYEYAKEVRINRAETYTSNKYDGIMKSQLEKLKKLFLKRTGINILSAVITIIQSASMYLYFSYMVFSGNISISEYTILLGSTTLFVSLILGFFEIVALFGRSCSLLDYYLDYQNAIIKNSNIYASNKLPHPSVNFSSPVIRFENVSFTYPNTENPILKNINLELKPNERTGLVGLNGSGKTTFVKLLTRLYDPTEGMITINGTDIKDIPYKQYSALIGVVLQDYYLFAYSVKENITLETPYDEKKLRSALKESGSDKKIEALKNGIDTSVSKVLDKDGIEFSGGEGQKLALARAIYKNSPILVLDEPTSALDPIAEYELFSRLNDISKNKLTLYISHRLSSTKFCDKIVVLSDGEIAEIGSHNELMDRGGLYCELFTSQAKYYKEG
jgi:ABC transporter, ATP-binding protein